MPLSKENVEKFREIWLKEFGTEISYAEAEEKGQRLIDLVKLIYKPIPRKYLNDNVG